MTDKQRQRRYLILEDYELGGDMRKQITNQELQELALKWLIEKKSSLPTPKAKGNITCHN